MGAAEEETAMLKSYDAKIRELLGTPEKLRLMRGHDQAGH
jgi:hypothetical protein